MSIHLSIAFSLLTSPSLHPTPHNSSSKHKSTMSSTPTTPSSSPLTFGPPTSQWHYNRTTRTYDLTRSSAKKLTIATTAGPEAKISIDPAISVLVVVDMQNFFLSPKCRDHPLGLAAVEPTIRVLERCREVGVKVCVVHFCLFCVGMVR